MTLFLLATLSLALFFTITILGFQTYRMVVSSHGTVKTVGVGIYWDSKCTLAVSSINWGEVEPGLSSNVTFYVMNEGNRPATLFLDSNNWFPEKALDYLALSWDYDGEIVGPNETVRVTLTLLASQNTEGLMDFGFDVIIGAV